MKIGKLEIRPVAVECWPPGAFRCTGPRGRFLYLQLAVTTIEIAWLNGSGWWDE